MRYLALMFGLAFAPPAFADPVTECIAENVSVTATFDEFYWRGAYYNLELNNGLSIPIGGLVLGYELWAEGRPLPLETGHWGEFRIINGGLFSGEQARMRVSIVLEKRELELATSASNLQLQLFVENVADIDLRPLGPRPNPYFGWQDGNRSDYPCEAFSG